MSPFQKTVEKLAYSKIVIEQAIGSLNWDEAEKESDALRDYVTCFYCIEYRHELKGHFDGVCGYCPCHKLGEKILGRPRGCNGCYVIQVYRDMVRNAHWFEDVKSEDSAKALVVSIQNVIDYMNAHKEELGG